MAWLIRICSRLRQLRCVIAPCLLGANFYCFENSHASALQFAVTIRGESLSRDRKRSLPELDATVVGVFG
jgi:hypothetical protein